jgi:hypothetical protein
MNVVTQIYLKKILLPHQEVVNFEFISPNFKDKM